MNQLEENSKIFRWNLPDSKISTKWRRRIEKRAQRRVEIQKDMDELHNFISSGRMISQEWKTVQQSIGTRKIKTAVFDSGATSNCGMVGDDFILTRDKSNKIFHMPTGKTAPASVKAKLHYMVREPAHTMDMVPNLKQNSLMSASKFAHAQYITFLTPTEVLVYDDMGGLHLSISGEAILRGWRCKHSGMWQVQLTPVVLNENTDTIFLD